MLSIAKDLKLPADAITQTFGFIGRKGSGKTYAAGKLAELLIDAGGQVVILDSVGNWYGLRLARDGKSPGLDVPILGGLRGDIALQAEGGALTADAVVETGRSLVIDISQFSKHDRQTFATAFGERLWKRKKAEIHPTAVHLVIEESQLIIPQEFRADAARMVGIYEELVRLGRNYGIGVSMITQRPQSVNKEVLNQTECLFAFQVNGAHERKALKEWIVHQGADAAMLNELPTLQPGECYIWSPQWLRLFRRIHVAEKRTFDSTSTPRAGSGTFRGKTLKPLDLKEFESRMSSAIEKAKADDPRELRRRISELEKELKAAGSQKPTVERIEVPVLPDHIADVMQECATDFRAISSEILTSLAHLGAGGPKVVHTGKAPDVQQIREALKTCPGGSEPSRSKRVASRMSEKQETLPKSQAQSGANGLSVGGGMRRMLTALAQRPNGLNAAQLGVRAGLSSGSGTFGTYLGTLRKNYWISGSKDRMQITPAGLDALGTYDPLPEGRELLAYWLRQLGQSGAARMLQALAASYPEPLTKEELGEAADISSSSGTFGTYLGTLRRLELIAGKSELRASDELFD